MEFRPYHRFENNFKLERLVNKLRKSGHIPDGVCENFFRYHQGMTQKLHAAKYNIDRLNGKLTNPEMMEAADTTGDFMFETNMFVDGFFYNSGSSLDILARIVLTLFGIALPNRVYFETAFNKLTSVRPGDPILPKLRHPVWRPLFLDYRNTQTHEVILLSRIHIDIENFGNEQIRKIVFPLPDNPRVLPRIRTFEQNPDVIKYITQQFTRILSIANTVYGDIYSRGRISGAFPI